VTVGFNKKQEIFWSTRKIIFFFFFNRKYMDFVASYNIQNQGEVISGKRGEKDTELMKKDKY